MKSLFISYDGATDNLGQSQIIPYLKAFSNRGIKIFLLSFEKQDDFINNNLLTAKTLFDSGIKWRPMKYHKSPTLPATLYDIFAGVAVGSMMIIKHKIDVIHARIFIGALIAVILKKIFNMKFILDLKGFWVEERVEAKIFSRESLLYKVTKYIEKIILLNADEIIALTENGKKEMLGYEFLKTKPPNITVIPTCVDIKRFQSSFKTDDDSLKINNLRNRFIFVYIGSVSTWYMPENMVNFFYTSKNYFKNAFFLLLTKEVNYLNKVFSKKSLITDHSLVLSVPHKTIPHYLSLSKVGIAFYKPGYSRKACSPTKLGEYLASGMPVVINSNIGDCDNIVEGEKVGVILRDFSENGFKKAAMELSGLLEEGEELKKRCFSVAEKYFSLERGVNKYLEVYNSLELRNSSRYGL